jgi:hypothetical protein
LAQRVRVDDLDAAARQRQHPELAQLLQRLVGRRPRRPGHGREILLRQGHGDRDSVTQVEASDLVEPTGDTSVGGHEVCLSDQLGEVVHPPGQHLEQRVVEVGVCPTHLVDRGASQREGLDRLQGHDARGPLVPLGEQRQLAEHVPDSHDAQRDRVTCRCGDAGGCSALAQQVQDVTDVTLVEDHLAAAVPPKLAGGDDGVAGRLRHVVER